MFSILQNITAHITFWQWSSTQLHLRACTSCGTLVIPLAYVPMSSFKSIDSRLSWLRFQFLFPQLFLPLRTLFLSTNTPLFPIFCCMSLKNVIYNAKCVYNTLHNFSGNLNIIDSMSKLIWQYISEVSLDDLVLRQRSCMLLNLLIIIISWLPQCSINNKVPQSMLTMRHSPKPYMMVAKPSCTKRIYRL